MTAKAKITKYLTENPGVSNSEAAKALNSTYKYIANIRTTLHKSGVITKYSQRAGDEHTALLDECDTVGLPSDNVTNYWYKGKHFSIMVKKKPVSYLDIAGELMEEMKQYAPKYKAVKYDKIKDGHLLVIDPADIHIGKLCRAFETGDEYNHKIAVNRVHSGVNGIIHKSQGFPVEKILFIIGNDMLHVDNANSSTTSGTHQDSELMWYDAFKIAFKLQVDCIERLSTIAPVHIQYDPSNHDYLTGFFLAQSLEAWFRLSPNVTFNVSPAHRKYFVYHKNLIGSTHGDGAKWADLGYLMAHESKDWNACPHRYMYVHHIHHKRTVDQLSVYVESLRSPSGTDSWHHRNGYQHAPKAVEGFIHHPEYGRIAGLTHLF